MSGSETIGERLRRIREERGLTQRDLIAPGVSAQYISKIERGQRNASVKALRRIAPKLGITAQFLETGLTYEAGATGMTPHWRCIRDNKGRIMVAICHNMDLGDAWEHSDNPLYPEKYASLAYRIAMNYFIYDLTH